MGFLEELEKVSQENVRSILFFVASIIIPGLTILFLNFELFKEVGSLILLIISIVYSFPLFFTNLLIIIVWSRNRKGGVEIFQDMGLASMFAMYFFYTSLLIFFAFNFFPQITPKFLPQLSLLQIVYGVPLIVLVFSIILGFGYDLLK